MRLVLATRRSALALAQSGTVADALRALGHDVEVMEVVTEGDRRSATGGRLDGGDVKGLFVRELEHALLDGRADVAVHSAKDLPGELPDGLAILAVPRRADPRDVIVGARDLPAGARVGTGSPRRRAQLGDHRPDLVAVDVRGNVDTRIAKLGRGDMDALMLAAAGLARLGRDDVLSGATPLDPEVFVPAPGQGCLAVEARAGRAELAEALAALDHAASHVALRAERAFLAALGGGCATPTGALCTVAAGELVVRGYVSGEAGGRRATVRGGTGDPEAAGRRLAAELGTAG